MIKNNLKILIITSIIILLPILAGVALWNQLPESVPIHWNAAGEVDGWASRAVAVFGLPAFLLAIHWVGVVATFSDPKKQNHSQKILALVFWLVPVLSLVLMAVTYFSAMGQDVRIEIIVYMMLGLLFVFVGNYLPKCKQNYTIGIKIPWTLHSEENWNRTHRLAGYVWVGCGFAMMIAGIFGLAWVVLAAALVMVFVPVIYSFVLNHKGI